MRFILFLLTLFFLTDAFAQDFNSGADEVFRENEVTEIRVTLSAQDKAFLLANENAYSETYVPANVSFSNSELDDATINNVGIRLRGNTARSHPKKSFKIDFKEFGGERWESYKKINLKPNVNDPSLIRELLTMHYYRLMDVPAPRIAPATLYFNNEYMGVYLMVEQIDDEFVDKRFGKEVGWLYKCAFSATLEDNGQVFDTNLYESKMNESTDTRAELDHFVEVLNNTSDDQFAAEISEIFAVDRYLRQLAVEAITGHWDGYSYLNNNYYLYWDEDAGQMEFIVYDTDNTWGIDWVDRDWATRDLNHFHRNGHPRPLTSRILDVPEWKSWYYAYLNVLFEEYFNADYLFPLLNTLENVLDSHVESDVRFDDSFGFSYEDFKGAFDYETNGHVDYGIRGFMETRRSTGIESIPNIVLSADEIDEVKLYPNPTVDGILRIKGKPHTQLQVSVFDLFGRAVQIRSTRMGADLTEVHILAEPGIYFLKTDRDSKAHRIHVK